MDEAEPVKKTVIRVREFDVERDLRAVEELERLCQVGLSGDQGSDSVADDHDGGGAEKTARSSKKKKKKGMSLYVEQIGDPFARVRHAPDNVMLVISLSHSAGLHPAAAIDDLACLRHDDSDAHEVCLICAGC